MVSGVCQWGPNPIVVAVFCCCGVGMERPYIAVDEEHIRIWGFIEGLSQLDNKS